VDILIAIPIIMSRTSIIDAAEALHRITFKTNGQSGQKIVKGMGLMVQE